MTQVAVADSLTSENSSQPIVSLDFKPSDAVMNPNQPIIYLTDGSQNRLVAVNYQTGELSYLSLNMKPEHLTFANGELFVTLLKSTHQWSNPNSLSGAIAIIDPQTFTLSDQFDIYTDPFGIAVDHQGNIYITPGSNQFESVYVYSRQTHALIASLKNFRAWSVALLQPETDKLYTMSTESVPMDPNNPPSQERIDDLNKNLISYRLVGNQLIQDYTNYQMIWHHFWTPIRFSPDGHYLFNGSGEVLDPDFQYVTSISPFSDIAFDPVSKHFYTASKDDHSIQEYAFNNQNSDGLDQLDSVQSYEITGSVAYLFYQAAKLIAVSQNSSGGYLLETIFVPARDQYVPNNYMKQMIPLDFTPAQTILDPQNPILYMTDIVDNKVYAVNYETQQVKSVQLEFPPERMAYENGELFVTLHKGSVHPTANGPGLIRIFKADTLEPVDQLDLGFEPGDFVVKDDSIIVIPGVWSGTGVTSYSRQTKEIISTGTSYLDQNLAQLNPTLDRVYTTEPPASSRHDLFYFNIVDGKIDDNLKENINYDCGGFFRISPDGNRIYTGSGEIFDQDLNHMASLNHSFNDFTFSSDSQRVYAANSEDQAIHIYDQKDTAKYSEVGALTTLGEPQTIFNRNDRLIVVSKNPSRDSITNPAWIEFINVKTDPNDGSLLLSAAYPTMDTTNVEINTPVALRFNHQIFVGDTSNISVKDANGQKVQTKVTAHAVNNILFLSFDQDLKYNSAYTVTVPGKAGIDSNGQGFSSDSYTLNFKTGQEFTRLGGYDLYDTAVKISQAGWQEANTVVLATGHSFQDALTAAPLAKKYNAPLLLTKQDKLPDQIAAEIDRLKVHQVFIVGGYAVISEALEKGLQAKGIKTVRLAGYDCYATSVAIAKYLGPASQVFLATGSNYPDALSIASYAANSRIPILLTRKNSLPADVKNYVRTNPISKSYVIGGVAVISSDVEANLPNAQRIAGKDCYDTNLAVLEEFGFDFGDTFFATGENFPDALAGSALAGQGGYPIVLLSKRTNQDVISTLQENKEIMKMKYTLGGQAVVPDALLTKIFGRK